MSDTTVGPNDISLAVIPEDVKVDIRRFTGFPAYGFGTTGFFELGLFLRVYETLELRMNGLTPLEYSRITDLYLPKLYQLETDIYNMRDTLLIDTAAVFKRNAEERNEREALLNRWRLDLCRFLGIGPGPELQRVTGGNNFKITLA